MPVQISVPYVRVDNRLGPKAANTLAGVGLTRSDAVRILLTRVALPAGLITDTEARDA